MCFKYIKTVAYSSPKKGLVIGVGLFLIVLLFISTLVRYHLNTEHKLKIGGLEHIRLSLVYAHLEKEDSTLATFRANHLVKIDAKEILKTWLAYNWDDRLIPLFSKKESLEFKTILKQVQRFKALLKQNTPESKKHHDALFNTLTANINKLNLQLKKRLLRQNNFLYATQIILIVVVIGWLVFTIITLRYVKADRKKMQSVQEDLLKKLKRNNFFLQKAQDISNLGYYTFNLTTREWTASDFILDLVAYKKGDNILDDWEKIVHPDDGDVLPKIFCDNTATGDFSFDLTYRIIRKPEGEMRWIHHVAGKLEDVDNQRNIAVIGVVQDITKRKNNEEIIIQSHQRFKSLFNENPVGLWEEDFSEIIALLNKKKQEVSNIEAYLENNPQFILKCMFKDTIISVNKSILNMFKVANNEDFSKLLRAHFSEEHIALYKKGLLAIIYNKRSIEGELSFITKTGKTINTLVKVVRIADTGKVVFAIDDITPLKEGEKALKESHKKLEEAQNITGLGTFSFDTKTGLFKTSLLFNKIIGITDNSIKDIEAFIKLSPPDDCQYLDTLFYDKSITKIKKEFRVQRPKDKTTIWILLHAKKTYSHDFKLLSITGTIQDITFRKEAEEKVKQSDAILNKIDSLVLVNDGQSNMVYVSPSVRQILGYEPEELFGQGWWQLTYETPKEAKEVQEAVSNYLYHDGPKIEKVSFRKIKTKTGGFKHIEWHISKGVGKTYINIGIDITQSYREAKIKDLIFNITKEAQKQPQLTSLLHFIKESLSAVIDTSNFYVALYNAAKQNFSLPYVSGEDANLQGKTFPMGKSLTGYVLHKAQTTVITDSGFEVLRKKGAVELVGKSSKIWVGIPLFEANKAIGVIVVQSFTDTNAFTPKDISLLELIAINISVVIKQAQDYEKIQLLNQAMIQSPASIVITDRLGCIEYVNPTFTKLSGYTFEEAVGQNPRLLKSGVQDAAYYKNLWDTMAMGKTWRGEFVNKRKDGSKYLVSVSISPVKDISGEITHFIGIQEDITKKRQLERDYLYAFIEAQEEEKVHFGEELHDGISQILAAEAMYIQILIKQNKDRLEGKAQYLLKVRDLNISAIEEARAISHGLMSKQLKEQGLIKAVAHICNDFNKSKNINFKFSCKNLKETEISKEIKTNLFRVTQEISTNIVRHSVAKNASVSFEKTPDNNLILLIKDDGVGIDLEKIKKEKKGAGLKNIERRIALLNGKVTIDSKPNAGTCFTIEVPLEHMR